MLLFTGKGGVGKTSVAAATAVTAAADGARVLVTSTDPAHSLGDVLDTAVGDGPTPVALPAGVAAAEGRLEAQQIDAQARLEQRWGAVRDYLGAVLAWGGVGDVAAEELVVFPGLDELLALLDLDEQLAEARHDLVIVDCAPTAETLKLLALPDALRWYADRLLGPGRHLARAVRPLARPRGAGGDPLPVPDASLFDLIGHLHRRLVDVHRLLTDPARASVRLVANPERVVLAEAERTATTLSLFGYAVDAVVLNRMLPAVVTDPFLAGWQQRQATHLEAARAAFAPAPVLPADLAAEELVGVDALEGFGRSLYAELAPAAVLADGRPVRLDAEGGGHVLRISLPAVDDGQVDLHRRGGDLHVKVAGVRRNLPLPAVLRRAEVVGASLRDGVLTLRFEPAPVAATGS